MIMDMFLVDVGADNKGVVSLSETAVQLTAQAVSLLWGNFPRDKGLPNLVGNHIIGSTFSTGLGEVLPLGKKKLGVRDPTVALVAGDKSAVVGFLWIFNVVDDVSNGFPHRPALAGVQGNKACGCYSSASCLL